MSKQVKLEARERIAQILRAALEIAPRVGYNRMTRDEIARRAKVPPALVTYHLGTMPDLRRQVMREAIRVECLPVIAQGLAVRDRHALKAPDELRNKALQFLRG